MLYIFLHCLFYYLCDMTCMTVQVILVSLIRNAVDASHEVEPNNNDNLDDEWNTCFISN